MKNRCKELRGGRSQSTVAEFLGMTQQAYSSIENSKNLPSMKNCMKISKFFGKPIEYIFQEEKENNN